MRAYELFQRLKVRLIPVKGPELDFTSANGRLVAHILGEVDTNEAEVIGERIQRQVIQRAELGKNHGGPRGYGISADGVALVEDEADNIRNWYSLIAAGGSIASIVRESKLHHSSVKDILLNPRNAGFRLLTGQEYPTPHPAVVDRDLWETVRVILTNPARGHRRGDRVRWLGSNIYQCGACNSSHQMSSKYFGTGHRIYIHRECGRWWSADAIDEHVERVVRAWIKKFVRKPVPPTRKRAGSELAAKRLRLSQVKESFELDDDVDEFKAVVKRLKREIADLQAKTAMDTSSDVLSSLSTDLWDTLTDPHRKRAILKTIMTVTLEPAPKD